MGNSLLADEAAKIGIDISEEQQLKFNTYSNFLIEYNEKVNLTAITDPQEIEIKHFLDSIMPLTLTNIGQNKSLIDVGTGAGFPGIPMKIIRPDLKLTLLDSLNKRLAFLEQLSEMMDQQNQLVHARAEIAGIDDKHREKYDIATSRAVASLAVLCEYCLPLLKVGGVMLSLKGPDCGQELKSAASAIKVLGGGEAELLSYFLPDGSGRTLVVIKKIAHTQKKYPRQRVKLADKPL